MTELPFIKMEASGNDYVYVDAGITPQGLDPARLEPIEPLARAISDRHTGVGSDGLILMLPGNESPVSMRMCDTT